MSVPFWYLCIVLERLCNQLDGYGPFCNAIKWIYYYRMVRLLLRVLGRLQDNADMNCNWKYGLPKGNHLLKIRLNNRDSKYDARFDDIMHSGSKRPHRNVYQFCKSSQNKIGAHIQHTPSYFLKEDPLLLIHSSGIIVRHRSQRERERGSHPLLPTFTELEINQRGEQVLWVIISAVIHSGNLSSHPDVLPSPL